MEYGFEVQSRFHERYSPITKKIFRLLSENSRASISEMSNALGISRRTISERLKKLESESGLRYTLELNEANLGLNNPHLILVKFDAKPDYAKIKEMLHSSYIPQLAVTMKGSEQMIIYANAKAGKEYAHWDRSMRMMLAKYKPSWQPSEVAHRQLGFFPLRSEIIDKSTMPEKYKPMLKLLNRNSRMSFQDISKELNMNFNTAAYNFNNLKKMSFIDRFTATIGMPQGTTFVAFFSKYTPSEGYEKASAEARRAFTSDDDNPMVSRYLITAPLIGSYDFFGIGAFDSMESALKHGVSYHKKLFKRYNVKMVHGELKEVLLGSLPIRSLDNKNDYKAISWNPGE